MKLRSLPIVCVASAALCMSTCPATCRAAEVDWATRIRIAQAQANAQTGLAPVRMRSPAAASAPPANSNVPRAEADSIKWVDEDDAWDSGRYMWVHFTDAPYCAPCEYEEGMFSDPRVVLATQGMSCVVMCWCDPDLRDRIKQYGVRAFPTDIVVDPGRTAMTRREGAPKSVGELVKFLEQVGRASSARP